MAQFARPSSDVAYSMLGATPINTAGNRYQNIDETSPVDTDYCYSQNNPGGSGSAEFGLSSVTDPSSSSGHVLRFRHMQIDENSGGHPQSANTGGTATSLAWELRQGATVIASGSVSPQALTTTSVTLSGTEADSITNYADLRVFVNPSGGGGSPANRRAVAVTWIEFEVPNAASATPQALPATSTLTPALARLLLFDRSLAVGSTHAPVLAGQSLRFRTLSVGSTLAPALSKRLAMVLAITSSMGAGIAFVFNLSLAAATTLGVALTRRPTFSVPLAATSTFVPGLVRIVGLQLAIAGVFAVVAQRELYVTLAVSSTMSAAFQREIHLTLAAAATFAAALTHRAARALAATASFVGALATLFIPGGGPGDPVSILLRRLLHLRR